MEEYYLDMEEFEREKEDKNNIHIVARLPRECDFLAPIHCSDLEETNQVDQRARDCEKEMIEDGRYIKQIQG